MKTKKQIKIINKAIKYLKGDKGNTLSLCGYLVWALNDYTNVFINVCSVGEYIPLFTRENAIKYGDASQKRSDENNAFWWGVHDYKNRLLFLLWIKGQLEAQLKEETKAL